jgi:hypothetical protein
MLGKATWAATAVCSLLVSGCAADSGPAAPQAFARSPLFPFEDTPHPNSREQLVAALEDHGFLARDREPGTWLGPSIRAFQRSQNLPQTGWPDDETLRRLGIDPRTRDSSLWPFQDAPPAASAIGVAH